MWRSISHQETFLKIVSLLLRTGGASAKRSKYVYIYPQIVIPIILTHLIHLYVNIHFSLKKDFSYHTLRGLYVLLYVILVVYYCLLLRPRRSSPFSTTIFPQLMIARFYLCHVAPLPIFDEKVPFEMYSYS